MIKQLKKIKCNSDEVYRMKKKKLQNIHRMENKYRTLFFKRIKKTTKKSTNN